MVFAALAPPPLTHTIAASTFTAFVVVAQACLFVVCVIAALQDPRSLSRSLPVPTQVRASFHTSMRFTAPLSPRVLSAQLFVRSL